MSPVVKATSSQSLEKFDDQSTKDSILNEFICEHEIKYNQDFSKECKEEICDQRRAEEYDNRFSSIICDDNNAKSDDSSSHGSSKYM